MMSARPRPSIDTWNLALMSELMLRAFMWERGEARYVALEASSFRIDIGNVVYALDV